MELAKIKHIGLNYQDRNILMLQFIVDYEHGATQNIFGGLVLDDAIKDSKGNYYRQGTSFGCEIIRLILDALKINDLSEGKGKYIYVLGEGEVLSFKPKGFKTLYVDGDQKKIIIDEVIKKMVEKDNK